MQGCHDLIPMNRQIHSGIRRFAIGLALTVFTYTLEAGSATWNVNPWRQPLAHSCKLDARNGAQQRIGHGELRGLEHEQSWG